MIIQQLYGSCLWTCSARVCTEQKKSHGNNVHCNQTQNNMVQGQHNMKQNLHRTVILIIQHIHFLFILKNSGKDHTHTGKMGN